MAAVNKVLLVGNCGRDPEVRYMANGTAVANVSLATSFRRKDRSSGETIEDTQWHRIVFYDKQAETIGQYVHKGDPLYVEGRIVYRRYTGSDGVEKFSTEIIAREFQLLGSRHDPDREEQHPTRPPPVRPQGPTRQASIPGAGGASGFDDFDSDVPF